MHHPIQLNVMFPWLVNLYITNYNVVIMYITLLFQRNTTNDVNK